MITANLEHVFSVFNIATYCLFFLLVILGISMLSKAYLQLTWQIVSSLFKYFYVHRWSKL